MHLKHSWSYNRVYPYEILAFSILQIAIGSSLMFLSWKQIDLSRELWFPSLLRVSVQGSLEHGHCTWMLPGQVLPICQESSVDFLPVFIG